MASEFDPVRRRMLAASALAMTGLVLDDAYAQQQLPATPQCHDGDEPTMRQTEGPYFKPSSPQRADLVEPTTKGRLVELNGLVLTRACRPVARALVDLWHADERGDYDNTASAIAATSSPTTRAAIASAPSCRRSIPAARATITSRCRRRSRRCSPRSSIFPTSPANARDGLFRRELVMRVAEGRRRHSRRASISCSTCG